jgi:hypothetical protein
MRTLSDGGSNDRPLERKLFGTTPNLDLFNTRTLSIWQLIFVAMVMNMNPIVVVVLVNVLCIQLLKYHDKDDLVMHIWQLTKVYVTNGKDTDDHKLQYFPNSLRGRAIVWFSRYGIVHIMATWDEVQWAFISWFSEICSEGQATTTLRYAKQKKYESVKDYHDKFLWLCVIIP